MTNWIELLQDFKSKKQPIAFVTITKVLGSAPCKVASKMIVTLQKEIFGTIGGGKLEFQVIDEAVTAIRENKIKEFTYTLGPEFEQCCGGKVELIIEPMNQTPELFLCGAGHIGIELCHMLKDTPFHITLLDTRENWGSTLTIDKDITFSSIDFDMYKQYINWGPNCYVVIMTHDHKLDFEITALALHSETNYIGLIGSKTKKNKFNNMLRNELNFEEGISPVHCPVGLDLGGHTPKEIAISIAAELLKEYYGK
ncbi:MAG: xanthine dehydrogenase accessory protein XdhC [Lutibacter sp.]|uniref:xanthine dehydrogenase accessory protein XdhC n=1 Tax=Lutibacter sp. TaxID=1925666 RepID=UPI0017D1C711|nr:xanthine dehydrogenase accessory protein XdhC [Lutibacter sp.]MBT8317255.1 xanthine dehydrogenase accessory protein XdhC [Lutibacter sp.]NNJ58114.1 xanthine dehydrogenase accessory protein XdhC [Lutibacter sp.]